MIELLFCLPDDVNNHDKKNPVSSVLNQVGNISLKDNLADKKLLKRFDHFSTRIPRVVVRLLDWMCVFG